MTGESSLKLWIAGARPKTLPAAVAPVLVGAACVSLDANSEGVFANGFLALIVSLALQVGVNFANDYSDGVRGTDDQRVGPMRLVGSGAKSAGSVKRAAFLAFGIAAIFGLILAVLTTFWLIPVGFACLAAGWFYTGGSKPYGYFGFGELFVFVFFGLVATTGTTFVIAQKISYDSVIASIAVGSLACALLVVNNLRDIPGDTLVGKKTLAVRLGDSRTRRMYYALVLVSGFAIVALAVNNPTAIIGLFGLITVIPAMRKISQGAVGKDLIEVLSTTGRTQILMSITLSIGFVLS